MTEDDVRRELDGHPRPPRMLRKLGGSVGIGVFAYLLTNVWIDHIDEKQIWVITLSLLIGAVVFLTQSMRRFFHVSQPSGRRLSINIASKSWTAIAGSPSSWLAPG